MKLSLLSAVIAIVLLITSGTALLAQSTNATLSGIVHDPQGAVVPNATIVVMQSGTGQSNRVVSDDTGNYSLTNLPTAVRLDVE